MKQTWKGINSLIFNSRKKLKQIMAIRRTDNSLSTNMAEIPNLLNNRFATVGKSLFPAFHPPNNHFLIACQVIQSPIPSFLIQSFQLI